MIKRHTIPKTLAEKIQRYLSVEPKTENECLSEDEIISVIIPFGNGIEMDVKCCGVQFHENESNLAWTEAVLFDHGSQVAYTDPSDEFLGEWTLEYENVTYTAIIETDDE